MKNDYTKGIVESEHLRSSKLADLARILPTFSGNEGYKEAQSKCLKLLNSYFHLLFLRCERWEVERAAIRLTRYWNERIRLFGPEKAFLSLSWDGALCDDYAASRLGVFTILPSQDLDGSSLLWIDASAFPPRNQGVSRVSTCRYLWYIIHEALKNENSQIHGIVILLFSRQAMHWNQFDRERVRLNVTSVKGCLPVRVKAIYICQPPAWLSLAWPIGRMLMGERLSRRVSLLSGSQKAVIEQLEQQYGLSADRIPIDIGGNLQLGDETFLESCRQPNSVSAKSLLVGFMEFST